MSGRIGLRVGQKHVAFFVGRDAISTGAADTCTGSANAVGGAEADPLGRRLVARVHGASLATYKEPSHTPGHGPNEIHRVEGVSESAQSEPASLVRRLAISVEIGDFGWVGCFERILLPGEGP